MLCLCFSAAFVSCFSLEQNPKPGCPEAGVLPPPVPWQDLDLSLEASKELLRASRGVWALGRVLATSVLSCSFRSGSTSVLGLWQLYLFVVLLSIIQIRNRCSCSSLPSDQPGHSSTAGHCSPRAPASLGAVLKGKAFGQNGLTSSIRSLGTCNTVTTC